MSSMASTQSLDRKPAEDAAPAVLAPAPARKSKARPYLILGGVVGLALAVYGGVTWMARGKENTDDAQVDADIVTVSTRVSGPVLKLYVHSNQQVKKDQPLVDIDPADYAARAKQA